MIIEVWARSGPRYQFLMADGMPLPPQIRLSFGPLCGRLLNAWLMQDGSVVYVEQGVKLEAVGV